MQGDREPVRTARVPVHLGPGEDCRRIEPNIGRAIRSVGSVVTVKDKVESVHRVEEARKALLVFYERAEGWIRCIARTQRGKYGIARAVGGGEDEVDDEMARGRDEI